MGKRCLEYAGIFCCLFFSLLAALSVWRYIVPFKEVCGILASYVVSVEPSWTDIQYRVVTLIRLPRVLGAGLAGATLAMAGAALQAILKNPLVSPQVIGVSTGAAFGGVLALLLFESSLATMGLAYAGGLFSLIAVWVLCNRGRGTSPLSLVLGGIIITLFSRLSFP